MVVAKSVNLVSCWTVLVNLVVVCCGSKNNHGHGGSKQLHPLPGTATDVVTPWIQSFCRQAGCEFYSEIPSSFIKDPVTTATVCVSLDSPYVDAAIRLINGDTIPPNTPFASSSSQHPSKREAHEINAVAEHLYDLLHARYVITYEGRVIDTCIILYRFPPAINLLPPLLSTPTPSSALHLSPSLI